MKACIIHNTLNSVGGGERVCLTVIEALKLMGFKVKLITAEPTDWSLVRHTVGDIVIPDEESSVLPFRVKAFGIYTRLLTFLKIDRNCDLIINTHGDVLPFSSDIIYMHFPTFTLTREAPANIKYSRSLFWRAYFYPYEKIQSYLVKRIRWRILLTNSEFSKEAIKKYVGAEAMILYPPVNIDDFIKVSATKNREDRVVLCGRYTPEKNYELALMVAKELPDVEFIIIGAYSGKVSNAYYAKLMKMKSELKLKNVKLLKNISKKEQLKIYSRSKVFMHTMINEHFGIAVVEGMAAGLIPVVHKSGGPWYDIIDRGRYGFGYENIGEAVRSIEKALQNHSALASLVIKRAQNFHKKYFIKKFTEIIKRITNVKRSK